MASSGTGKPLNVCPTNVKEALDWLEAFGPGASQCSQIITQKKIIGDNSGLDGNKAKGLCKRAKEFLEAIKKNGGSYKSAYDLGSWSTMCQSSGGKCCADNPACSGCTAGQCDGCCAKCPKQICARIFCMIVPVLRNVLMYMLGRCNTKNGKNGVWAEQTLNGTGSNGSSGTDLKNFMVACGFKENELNGTTKGGDLTMDDSGNILGLLVIPLGQMKNAINKALEENHNPTQHFLNGASPASNKKPSSLTDLLLWLQFLPYCSNYSDVISKVKAEINDSNGNGDLFVNDLPMAISHLPMLFLQIEGKGERGNTSPVHGSSLFLKIAELSKCQYIFDQKYYEEGTVVKMLLCVFPVIHWGLKALKDRCKNGSCGSTLKQCTETNKLLTYLGWNGTEGKPSVSGNMNCKTFRDYLSTNFLGNSSALAEMKKILEGVWKADNAPTGSSTTSGSHLPRTIYEMLIWLMGLPVSGKFKELKSEKKDEIKEALEPLTQILFEVPHLFLTLNGDLSGMLSSMFQCHGIGTSNGDTTFNYGSDGQSCLGIFSAIVAILYPVIRYLQQRCNGNGVFKDNGSWSTKNTNVAPLSEFLKFMGFTIISSNNTMQGKAFHTGVLQPIFGDLTQNGGKSTEKLGKLYECAVKAIQSTYQSGSSSGTTTTPTTIRQMMLWLIGLPVTKEYGDNSSGLMQEVQKKANGITDLSTKINNGSKNDLQVQLQHSIVGMMTIINQVEGGLGSVVNFLKDGFKDDNTHHLQYQSGDELFTSFTSYVTSVHVQLRFLKVMCGRQKDQGGWQECKYANGSCNCTGNVASCLKPFLQNGNNGSVSGENKFKLMNGSQQEHLQMGFKQYEAPQSQVVVQGTPSTSVTGDNISTHLELMLDDIPTTQSGGTVEFKKPLSLLTQYCVAIGQIEPQSLGDHFDVFRELAGDMWSKIQTQVKESVKQITKEDTEGTTASNALQKALQALWPSDHSNVTDHRTDLKSLTGCNGGTCSPFVASLSHGLYRYFDPTKLQVNLAQRINWLYMKMSGLYGKLTTLKKEMTEKCKCCPEGNTDGCKGIIKCPNCLPLMYKMGLVFGDPLTIGPKQCVKLHEMMEKVLDAASKLCVIFTSIEDGRFKPYLLFSAMVVENNNGKLTVTGDDNYNCYTYKLKEMYDAYLKDKKEKDTQAAQTNKTAREGHLACTCPPPHTYAAPKPGPGTATVVTLTLYFKGEQITEIKFVVPHHGPAFNPLVRFYPRNLKSIVDWLLRIGQTRLEQGDEKKGIEEMCNTFFPKIQGYVTGMEEDVFEKLVNGVTTMMGMENKGKEGVETEVEKEFKEVTEKLNKKLSNNGDGFEKTFSSILKFSPNSYINKVITDFGKQVKKVNTNGLQKDRSFECIAKSVSKCMEQSLDKIKDLAKQNKSEMAKYGVNDIEDLNGKTISDVQNLNGISDLKQLCEGFKTFHEVYKAVTGAFNGHLQQAQQNGEWTNINKCVEAFKELGQCVNTLSELGNYTTADSMTQAKEKLGELSEKLDTVIQQLNGEEIKTLSAQVDKFIEKLDGVLEGDGKQKLETALQLNNGKVTNFADLLQSYVSNVIQEMKNNTNNTVYDIHLRVRNDLQQLSECLKVMCEVCGTGMTEFAEKLKECVNKGKEHLEKINTTKDKLEKLKNDLEEINGGEKDKYDSDMKQKLNSAISTIHSLLSNQYIFQTQPIVSNFIQQSDVSKMTTYLKSLPDLIRDRYVLQKWSDSPEVFCGVQEFKEGIVKKTDTDGIKKKLQELLEDTYHTDDQQFPITIHEFQVRALIYNFCHEEGIKGIDCGIKVMRYLGFTIIKNEVDWEKMKEKKEKLEPILKEIAANSYLSYFATHLRDSIGYHGLSNTLGALDKVKEKLEAKPPNGEPAEWKNIQDLLKKETMETLHTKLQSLVAQLNREYIFEYPPFDWQKSCHRLVEQNKGSRAKRSAAAAAPAPSTPTTCSMCVPSMAQIFVGFVPQMYRLFKMLREMTTKDGSEHTLVYSNNGTDALKTTMSSLAGLLSREGWRLKLGSDMSSDDDEAFDLEHSKTGKELCDKLDEIIGDKEPGVLVAQDQASTAGDLKPLDRLFKAVMQHFKEKRKTLRQQREEKEKEAFEKNPSNKGIPFQAPPPVLPSTVRQVLFWLHELDTNKAFYDQMSQHIKALCTKSTIPISHDTILHVLKLSITQCLEVLATIEDPGRHNAQYYYDLYTEEHYYAYPTVNIPLFFYTFVEKLMGAFLELNFVCVQCEFRALEGGWSECHIGIPDRIVPKKLAEHECLCKTKEWNKSSDPRMPRTFFSKGTLPDGALCPRPLYSFLFDNKTDLKVPTDPNSRLPYMSKGTMPCGFQLKNKAITDPATQGDAHTPAPTPTSVSASVLVEPLRKLVGGHVTGRHNDTEQNTLRQVIYWRDLLRYTLCLAVRPPWSMSENMAFFYRVTESWKNKGGVRVALRNDNLLQSIHAEIALFPGTFDGKQLTSAVERFAGIEDNNKHQKTNATHSNTSHQFDLMTLMGCQELKTTSSGTTSQCSPFMFPLSLDVYTHYDHRNSRAYLSWILNFAFGIYGQLKALEERMKESACVRNTSSSMSDCPSLPMCPGVLTALYQSGSSFMDQGQLANKGNNTSGVTTTKKTCNDLHTVLGGLFNCNTNTSPMSCSPLHNLIVQCEAFLWSIRFPFSLVQLSLWSVAILFISYVFVVPLDHFKIKSHLFNRLKYTMHPSLLIADGQRRVSEVAYFSL